MGRDLVDASPAAREVFRRADAALAYSLSRLCFEGPDDELTRTAKAQPAIFVTSLAYLAAALEAGALARRPAFLAGHSLGEYTALVAAAALDFEEGLSLLQLRGRLMAEAGERNPGTMAAVMGLSDDRLQGICSETGAQICNRNSPGQVVIGGPVDAVARVVDAAKAAGAKAMLLNVSGAFHTSLMAPAVAELSGAIEAAAIRDPDVPVLANGNAQPLDTADGVREELNEQLLRPVLWQESVERMAEAGVSAFVEIGPGRVLIGLVKRTVAGVATLNINNLSSIQSLAHDRPEW